MPVTFKIKNVTNKRNMVVLNNDAEIHIQQCCTEKLDSINTKYLYLKRCIYFKLDYFEMNSNNEKM